MTDEGKTISLEPGEEAPKAPEGRRVTEELKVQAQDLFKTVDRLIHEGAVRRVTVMRRGRTLVDIPVTAGAVAVILLAIHMPTIAAIAAVGALLGGCTVRIEREELAQ